MYVRMRVFIFLDVYGKFLVNLIAILFIIFLYLHCRLIYYNTIMSRFVFDNVEYFKVQDSGTFESSCLLCSFYFQNSKVLKCFKPSIFDDCFVIGSFHYVSSSKKSKPVQLSLF